MKKVFVPHPQEMWLPGTVMESQGSVLTVLIEDVVTQENSSSCSLSAALVGSKLSVDLADPKVAQLINEQNSSSPNSTSLPFQNSLVNHVNGFDDMIAIDHLHEAAILYNLRHRFFRNCPYTYTGKICLAVNPYQWLDLYSPALMQKYNDGDRNVESPHVYATSMDAYRDMRKHGQNQALLVSGESGAGKTETTKIVMAHLAVLAKDHSHDKVSENDSQVIQQIIEANPLLESFGNAKTVRNDNSSRFGKFTELQFDGKGYLVGARSRTYLLEKSRIIHQNTGERNFHIFYQLLASSHDYPNLQLNSGHEYNYLTSDDTIKPEDMYKHFQKTIKALDLLGVHKDTQSSMWNILAAVLNLGEINFVQPNGDVDKSEIDSRSNTIPIVSSLLRVNENELGGVLCNRNVVVGRETFRKPMRCDQAFDARDALAKALYAKLFDWLVIQINAMISHNSHSHVSSFIGILDIFGFEHFEHNSFEQLCINYANEKLQQKFVQDILKTVQQEYEEEGISWSHITFQDNQEVLNLVEGRLGVISLLNEECLLATGSDSAFAHKLSAVMKENPLLETPRLQTSHFSIYHYAGKVTYDTQGFLDKHRDALLTDVSRLMHSSQNSMISNLFDIPDDQNSKAKRRGKGVPNNNASLRTVGTQFRASLSELMDRIGTTEVSYVRCIKPNSSKSPSAFDHQSVVAQLRCAGVIEAIRVSRSAYPSKLSHSDCLSKYAILAKSSELDNPVLEKEKCQQLLAILLPEGLVHDYQVGQSRVYFREGVIESLETKRGILLRDRIVLLQKTIRRYLCQTRYAFLRVKLVQLQSFFRRSFYRRRFLVLRFGMIQMQARIRGFNDRKKALKLKHHHSVVVTQSVIRRFLARKQYVRTRHAIVLIQHFWRRTCFRLSYQRRLAKKRHNTALENKVARLQSKLGTSSSIAASASIGNSSSKISSSSIKKDNNRSSDPSCASTVGNSVQRASTNTKGLFNESAEVIGVLSEENERLQKELEKLKNDNASFKKKNAELREWKQAKEVEDSVKTMATKTQAAKDLAYLSALEKEYDRVRIFICEQFSLDNNLGSLPTEHPNNSSTVDSEQDTNVKKPNSVLAHQRSMELAVDLDGNSEGRVLQATNLLTRCGIRLAKAKTKTGKGSARRVKDYWEEMKNFPPPMEYTLGSVPWKRLLTDWAQGNPKKLDYMTRWLKNVIEGGQIENGPFPMGVELKSVTPMMLDGFMQLVIPKLAEREDVDVHVHTKEFIGTSMRITLAAKSGELSNNSRSRSSNNSRNSSKHVLKRQTTIRNSSLVDENILAKSVENRRAPPPAPGSSNKSNQERMRERLSAAQASVSSRVSNSSSTSFSTTASEDDWGRGSIRSVRG